MHPRARGGLLAGAALVALAPFSGAAALAAHSGPATSHTTTDQRLTWSVVPSPNREGNGHIHSNVLHGISCPSASSCIAVGYAGISGPKTLVESWNGTAWSIVPSPNRLAVGQLNGISCLSATDCTAVGLSQPVKNSLQYRTLIETWDGSTWSLVPSPNPSRGQGQDVLHGVSCASASFCAAVGYHGKSPTVQALIETWNGSTWSVASVPDAKSSNLSGVSCLSASFCTAVGGASSPGPAGRTLVESWNGSTWSVVRSPNPGDRNNDSLAGVSCVSATDCTAVGTYVNRIGVRNLAESWNGTAWSVVHSPNPSNRGQFSLAGVSCTSASSCIAVGSYEIQAWNGSTWSIERPPRLLGQLNGVSCASATMCMAAGWRAGTEQARHPKTLTELGTPSG